MGIRETPIENYLRKEVKKAGGVVEKFKSPQKNNVPDDIVSWPTGMLDFVEVKAPGEEPTAAQKRDHARRRKMGHCVYVVNSEIGVHLYVCSALEQVRYRQKHGIGRPDPQYFPDDNFNSSLRRER